MRKLIFAVFILCSSLPIEAQNINGRFSASFYSFERFDTSNNSKVYVRNFESLQLNINQDKYSLRTRINFESNLSNTLDNDPRFRFYNLFFEARNLFDIATIKIGRQSLFNSVAGGIYDGVNLTDNFSNNYVFGGKLIITALNNFRFTASYIDKNFKPESYFATRLDSDLNTIRVLIERNSNQYKFLSAEASYIKQSTFSIKTKFDYDLNFKKASKLEALGRYEQIENLGISFYYNYREPRVSYNSIFSVFNYGNTQEVEGGLDYKITSLITIYGKYGNVTYEDDDTQRITVGVNTNYGTISYRKSLGYAGELDAVSLYTARSFMEGFITPSVGFTYTNYKLSENAQKNNLLALLAGLNVRPWIMWSFDLQGQFLNNKIYRNDFRVLFKINHWFNTNLDIL
jgi:hypothetical protein